MKKIPLLLTLAPAYAALSAQQTVASLTCRFKNVTAGSVRVVAPVNNTIFWASSKTISLAADGTCTVEVDETQTGYIVISGLGKTIRTFVQKGDHLHIEVDTADNATLHFEGNCAEGQRLLSDGQIPEEYYYIDRLFKSDTTLEMLSAHVNEEKENKKALFTALFNQHKINKAFLNFGHGHLDYLYATILSNSIARKFIPVTLPKNHPGYRAVFPEPYRQYWDKIFTEYPINNLAALQIPAFQMYTHSYIDLYLAY